MKYTVESCWTDSKVISDIQRIQWLSQCLGPQEVVPQMSSDFVTVFLTFHNKESRLKTDVGQFV
jgi:hypothetical protein